MNEFTIMGNLTKDPETRPASGNGSFTTFTVAVNDGFGDKKKTYFMDCAAGGKAGENIAKFFTKGKQGIFQGKLYTGENRKTGFQEIRLSVFKFHFTSDGNGGKGGNGNNGGNGGNGYNNNNGANGGGNSGGNGGNSNYNNNNNNNNQNNSNYNNNQNQGGGGNDGPVDDIPF